MSDKLVYEQYPGVVEVRKILQYAGFKNDLEACEYLGLHKFYVRDRTVAKTIDGKIGLDIPEHILIVFRLALKVHCTTRGNLFEVTNPIFKKLSFEETLHFANKNGFSKEKLENIGPVTGKTYSWIFRYVELLTFLKKDDRNYPWFKSISLKLYLEKIGLTTFEYSLLSKIPYPGLIKKGVLLPEYQIRLAELMYRYMMLAGSKIDVKKIVTIDFQQIFWKEKAVIIDLRNRRQVALNNFYNQKRLAKKEDNKEEIEKLDLIIEKRKVDIANLDIQLVYSIDELNNILHEENISYSIINKFAHSEQKRIIWRERVLPWSICFARLFNLYRAYPEEERGTDF